MAPTLRVQCIKGAMLFTTNLATYEATHWEQVNKNYNVELICSCAM